MSACLRPALVGIVAGLLAVIAVSPAHSHHLEYVIDDPGWNPDGVTLVGINRPWIIDGEPYSLCSEWDPIPGHMLAAIADWETVLPQTEFWPGCTGSHLLQIKRASLSGVPELCSEYAAGCAVWWMHTDNERGGKYTGTGNTSEFSAPFVAGSCPAMPWPTPIGDSDCDGFTTAQEDFVGTDSLDPCADTPDADDEADDKWPPDLNDDQLASLGDVLGYIPVFNTFPPGPPYDQRYDLNADSLIGLADVLKYIPVFNLTCTP